MNTADKWTHYIPTNMPGW